MKKLFCISFFLLSGVSFQTFAQEDCPPPTAFEQLDINNVRANYYNSGLEWNNSTTASGGYEIPKDNNRHSIFTGGMWLGGKDENDTIHLSVRQYFQTSSDWSLSPGPMNNDGAGNYITTDCELYDHIFKINRSEVVLHRLYFQMFSENGGAPPTDQPFENGYNIPQDILNWPAHAEVLPGEPQELAPFFDNDCCGGTPGIYEPELGDYPAFRFPDNEEEFNCDKHLLGDQVLWWVVNDAYGEVEGNFGIQYPFGMEVQNMAYAFISNDHIDNTTFLRRQFINRSDQSYFDVYYGEWIDGDLGGANDDQFGTDVNRGMAYYYNGDINDENDVGAFGYGYSPPAIGFDWVGGPEADLNDGLDNNYNGIVDEDGESLRLDYTQTYSNQGVEENSQYEMLSGNNPDGTPFTLGTTLEGKDILFKMVFPGDSDPLHLNTYGIPVEPWTALTIGLVPGDRRHLMSSGPFTFLPDEEKVFTMAIPWAREENCEEIPCSLQLLREVNDLAQDLHDNCYEMPCMVLDAQFEVEIEDGQAFFSSPVTSGVEYHWTFGDGNEVTTEIPFASHFYSDTNDFEVCLEIDFGCGTSSTCQSVGELLADLMLGPELTQIEGVGNTNNFMALTEETIEAILENDSSMVLHPKYKSGQGPVKVHIYNLDNIVEGDYVLKFDGTESESNWKMYIVGATDTVYSDVSIGTPNAQFIEDWGMMVSTDAHLSSNESEAIGAKMVFENENSTWLTHVSDTDDFTYQNWIREGNWGFNCSANAFNNCFNLDEEQTQLDPCFFNDGNYSSPSESFEKLLEGGWAPSHFVPFYNCQPRLNGGTPPTSGQPFNTPGLVRNIDLVFTSDKSLWTRCPIVDLRYGESQGGFITLRDALSVDKSGLNQDHPDCNVDEATFGGLQVDEMGMSYGMGWFPGYAIDVNTGKRLNLVFGENPDLADDNGNDMIWNPTSTVSLDGDIVNFGGQHSITVLSEHMTNPLLATYDGGTTVSGFIASSIPPIHRNFLRQQQWTGLPILNEGFELLPIEEGLIPTKTTIQLRLRHRYQNYLPDVVNINNGNPLYNFTIDYEDLISDVEEVEIDKNVLLYPNPAKDQLHLQLSGFEQQPHDVQIFALSGQLVKNERIGSITENTIDISALPNGVYILKVGSDDGQNILHKRFVVVR